MYISQCRNNGMLLKHIWKQRFYDIFHYSSPSAQCQCQSAVTKISDRENRSDLSWCGEHTGIVLENLMLALVMFSIQVAGKLP